MAPKRHQKQDTYVPDAFRELLVETRSSAPNREERRPVKRRRIGGKLVEQDVVAAEETASVKSEKLDVGHDLDDLFEEDVSSRQEILLSESEDSADSDVDWENVDLKQEGKDEEPDEITVPTEPIELNLVLDKGRESQDERPKRKAVTALEKKLRLEIHKLNICCLMIHVHIRNHWCNDDQIQGLLRRYVTKRTVSYLNPNESLSQFQRSRSFMDGLTQMSELFRGAFRKTARGMAKPQWSLPDQPHNSLDFVPDDIELPMEKEDFADAARDMAGSRDTGAQLLCSMLRGIGVEARLVCSLQPFQFRAVEKTATPQKQYSAYVSQARQATPENDGLKDLAHASPLPKAQREEKTSIADDYASPNGHKLVDRRRAPKRPIRESKFPIYWVEAFNAAVQKWVPIDPIVTQTIAKPLKLEPPLGERENDLSYVIAFEDDGSARDVTCRYAKAYNAKTRRDRVESTKGGQRWWKWVMKMFRRPSLDRDQVEDAELAANEAAEPMPRNVGDFKDHPYYALERHLRRHEVIHPKREVGKVGATGKGHASKSLELIYRRRDVLHVQSADKWFRMGREVKMGEQALKYVTPARKRGISVDEDDEMPDTDRAGTPLFSMQQTSLYRPEPVIDGKVSRNQYGNLDVYVPSMIPAGGAHIQHPSASRAAKVLGLSYADAVTGFKFAGRHGTAIVNGAIVAAECVEAVREIIIAVEDEKVALEQDKRAAAAMAMWKRFMIGLRIRERIEGYDIEGEDQGEGALPATNTQADESDEDEGGGGFFPDPDAHLDIESALPTTKMTEMNEDEFGPSISILDRPPPIIPVVFGPRASPATAESPRMALSPQPDLFDEEGDNVTRETTADPEAEIIQVAIAQSLAQSTASSLPTHAIDMTQEQVPEIPSLTVTTDTAPVVLIPDAPEPLRRDESPGTGANIAVEEKSGKLQARGDESDAGSLMSHDPEDEEADDWPESAGDEDE